MLADRTKVTRPAVARSFLLAGFSCAFVAATAQAQGHVVTWGLWVGDGRLHAESFVEVAAGNGYTVARRNDGSVVAWGWNDGPCNAPALPPGLTYVEVAAGGRHCVARRSDGSVVAWGDNSWGQCNVPALPPSLTYVEVAAGGFTPTVGEGHTVARRSDGSIVSWGCHFSGQCNVPTPPPG
ncbi:MAG TPA: hypothetical protein VFD07_04360, partial [Candidatus Krumholzibacteria bacterium]|nr:hypothetical protein [Candidatus Krumholzibacteria bacterium]